MITIERGDQQPAKHDVEVDPASAAVVERVEEQVPMPRHWNTFSVTITPPSSAATSSAVTVVSGMSAVRSACRTSTVRGRSPFERASRT